MKTIFKTIGILILILFISVIGAFGKLLGKSISNNLGNSQNINNQLISKTGQTQAHQRAHVNSCISAGSSKEYCNCTFDQIKEVYSPKDIIDIAKYFKNNSKFPDDFIKLVSECNALKK